MKYKKLAPLLLPTLVVLISLLPVQVALCQSMTAVKKITASSEKTVVKQTETSSQVENEKEDTKRNVTPVAETETTESSLSTGAIIGISAGAIALIGGAVALAGGGSDSSPPAPTPPTADQLVGPWRAAANQPGSGLTYTGTYQLFQGGGIAYNLYVSDGEHFIGGGSWRITEYTLYIHTDHGSHYVGTFVPGIITTVSLNADSGWTLTLAR